MFFARKQLMVFLLLYAELYADICCNGPLHFQLFDTIGVCRFDNYFYKPFNCCLSIESWEVYSNPQEMEFIDLEITATSLSIAASVLNPERYTAILKNWSSLIWKLLMHTFNFKIPKKRKMFPVCKPVHQHFEVNCAGRIFTSGGPQQDMNPLARV